VLYRSHFHALELQLEFTRRNLPFSITSGIRFFEQAHLKDLIAHLKLVCNPSDEMAFKRLAQMLPGVGAKAADKLWQKFNSECRASSSQRVAPAADTPLPTATSNLGTQISNLEARGSEPRVPPIARALQACARIAPKKAVSGWSHLAITMSQLEAKGSRGRPDEMVRIVLDAGYDEYLQETYANYQSRLQEIEGLASFARSFQGLEEFLTQLSLLSNLEAEDGRTTRADDERVRLSTIHQAKGLEFDVVFVIMLCEGMFPNARSLRSPEDEEEERRLFYVAITRARNELYLSHPLLRTMAASGADVMQQPSRFLSEIPRELLDEWNLVSWGTYH